MLSLSRCATIQYFPSTFNNGPLSQLVMTVTARSIAAAPVAREARVNATRAPGHFKRGSAFALSIFACFQDPVKLGFARSFFNRPPDLAKLHPSASDG